MRVAFSAGNLLAFLLSWTANHDIVWALIHGILGWLYVIGYVFGVVHR